MSDTFMICNPSKGKIKLKLDRNRAEQTVVKNRYCDDCSCSVLDCADPMHPGSRFAPPDLDALDPLMLVFPRPETVVDSESQVMDPLRLRPRYTAEQLRQLYARNKCGCGCDN